MRSQIHDRMRDVLSPRAGKHLSLPFVSMLASYLLYNNRYPLINYAEIDLGQFRHYAKRPTVDHSRKHLCIRIVLGIFPPVGHVGIDKVLAASEHVWEKYKFNNAPANRFVEVSASHAR